MQPLGERLGETVGERLEQDGVVVVDLLAERRDPVGSAQAGSDGERADVVLEAGRLGRDEVGERAVGHALAVLALLAQLVEDGTAARGASSR